MRVIVEKPYQFVPPHRGNGWPSWIQRFRLVDFYLKKKEGIVGYECRNLDRFSEALGRGDGILLTPNHCRYADPLALGWPARQLNTHVFAMASWHLFNSGRFDAFAIQKMGGFSINREGQDRQSLETAIEILATAERPLILFPEGTTNRTNDRLQPLLEGVTFIARNAARRRRKRTGGQVVVLPVGIKYVCHGNIIPWANQTIGEFEKRLGWRQDTSLSLVNRVTRIAEGLLALKEIEYTGASRSGPLKVRRDRLIEDLLVPIEEEYAISGADQPVLHRVRGVRSKLLPRLQDLRTPETRKIQLRHQLVSADLAQQLVSYVDDYLAENSATDTRLLETLQRLQEDFAEKMCPSFPLRVIIDFGEPIPVPAERASKGTNDPLLCSIESRLNEMLITLNDEANLLHKIVYQPS